MRRRRIISVDEDTGEIVPGVPVLYGVKVRSPYGRAWMQTNQSALLEIAKDPDIGSGALRVFLYLNGRLDFDNLIAVQQKEIAADLNMDKGSVSRAMKLLLQKQIILRDERLGRLGAYKLNEHYGWKGKVKKLRQRHLQLVEPGKDPEHPA